MDIKSVAKNPAMAIEFTIAGLKNAKNIENFEIDMNTFGKVAGGTCFGCAATCAMQEITGHNIADTLLELGNHRSDSTTLSEAYGVDPLQLDAFENAINFMRMGNLVPLFYFYGIKLYNYYGDMRDVSMDTDDWEDSLPALESVVKQMRINHHDWA